MSTVWRSPWAMLLSILLGACAARLERTQPEKGRQAEHVRVPMHAAAAPREGSRLPRRTPSHLVLPAEVGHTEAVLLGFSEDSWLYFPTYVTILREIATRSTVYLVVQGMEEQVVLTYELRASGIPMENLRFVHAPLDSMWIRDYGPLLVREKGGRIRAVDFRYGRAQDDRVPEHIARTLGWPLRRSPLQLDGGHVQADGTGRCIVSEDLLRINQPGHKQADLEHSLDVLLGCQRITWVPPLLDEETGHVDMYLYVTGPGRVLVGTYRPRDDPDNHLLLEVAAARLARQGFEVTRIAMPKNDDRHIFRTYTNVLPVNEVLLVPVYRAHRRFERAALRTLRKAFPDRILIPVPADDIVDLGGALHCLAMNVSSPPQLP